MARFTGWLPQDRPGWILSAATLIGAVGLGAFTTSSALFFTRSVGLAPGQVGVGIAVAGGFGLLGPVLAGRTADRLGARGVFVALALWQGLLFTGYAIVHSFGTFLVVICAMTLTERAAGVVRNAIIAQVSSANQRVRLKAYLRAVFNLGVSLGAAAAVVPIHLDTRYAYLILIYANAAAALVTAGLGAALPRLPPPAPAAGRVRRLAIRDTPYLSMAVLCGLLAVHHSLLVLAMPIWVATRTAAPTWVVSLLFLVNTGMSIALQVWASTRAVTVRRAISTARRGGWSLAVACAGFGAAAFLPPVPAVLVLVGAAGLLTLGELWTSAAAWELSFDLAGARAPGEYQGVFALGMSVELIGGPLLATAIVIGLGVPGWFLAGAVFLLLASLTTPVTRWASRTRLRAAPRPPVLTLAGP